MIDRIVVGFDGSPTTEAALSWAVTRASMWHVPIVLVAVVPRGGRRDASDVDSRAAQLMELDSSLRVSVRICHGPVSDALTKVARRGSLLVIGSGKSGFIHGRVFGSRALQTIVMARCDVVVVPQIDVRFRTGVVVGVDHPATAEKVAEAAAVDASGRNEVLQLLHATSRDSQASSRSTMERTEAHVRALWPDLSVQARTVFRPAAEALLDASRNAALLVLGPGSPEHGASPVRSVTHDILMNLNAPTLVVREAEYQAGEPSE